MTWEGIEGKLDKLHAPDPPADLLARILASRAAGVRVVLPAASRPPMAWSFGAVAAAVLLIAVAVASSLVRLERRSGSGSVDPYTFLLGGTLLEPSSGAAQEPAGATSAPRYPLIGLLTPERVHAGTWTYEAQTTIDDILTSKSGTLAVAITPGQHNGASVWRVTTWQPPLWSADTTYSSAAGLRPLRYAWRMRRASIIQDFGADSVIEVIHAIYDHGRQTRVLRARERLPMLPGAPFLAGWRLTDIAPLLQGISLERGWRGSVYQVRLLSGWRRRPGWLLFQPLDLRVRGSRRISVPAGRFDCWEVEIGEGEQRARLWVSKDAHWIIKTEERWTDVARKHELISYATPPAP
jgi:hypothetical protein